MFASKNDRQDESLTGQVHDQAGHCPLTGRYFEPWEKRKVAIGGRKVDTNILWGGCAFKQQFYVGTVGVL